MTLYKWLNGREATHVPGFRYRLKVWTPPVYLRRQDKAREMETVRGLTWGSSVFPASSAPPLAAGDQGSSGTHVSPGGDCRLASPAASGDSEVSGGDPVEVRPSDPRAGSQAGLNGPGGSPTSPPEPASVFPSNADVPPAGFEPAFPTNPHEGRDAAVTDTGSLPSVLLAKLETLRIGGKT